jgi:hypothetical protein
MPSSISDRERTLGADSPSLDERRQRLALACELDRLNLRLALRPTRVDGLALSVAAKMLPLARHFPGKIGRWSREVSHGAAFFRGIYDAFFSRRRPEMSLLVRKPNP